MTLAQMKPKLDDGEVFQTTGVVTELDGDELVVDSAKGIFRAARAVSCLVSPELGDQVLVAGPQNGRLFVLAITERPGDAATTIRSDGDLELAVAGRFSVSSNEGIELVSPRRVSVATAELEAHAGHAQFHFRQVGMLANIIDATAERISSRVKRVFRHVLEIEHVRSGQLDYEAKGTMRLHGGNTVLSARELIKADASQIHLG